MRTQVQWSLTVVASLHKKLYCGCIWEYSIHGDHRLHDDNDRDVQSWLHRALVPFKHLHKYSRSLQQTFRQKSVCSEPNKKYHTWAGHFS